MPEKIKPPQSLGDILPKVVEDVEERKIERQRNLRANEVFLQAENLLQSWQTEIPRKITSLFRKPRYRSLPPVPFEYEGQKTSIQLKDHGWTGISGSKYKDGISIVLSVGDVGREELELFHLEKIGEHWNPVLRMGPRYSIKNRYDNEVTGEGIETVAEILILIQEALKPLPKPQSQPGGRGDDGGDL